MHDLVQCNLLTQSVTRDQMMPRPLVFQRYRAWRDLKLFLETRTPVAHARWWLTTQDIGAICSTDPGAFYGVQRALV